MLRRGLDGTVDEVLGQPWNARTAVHEYGGGAWWVRDGVLWFADWATQRLHRLGTGGVPAPLSPEPAGSRGLRYADGDVSPDGTAVLCVQEEHNADGDVVNTIVRLDAAVPSSPEAVVAGPDFVSNPRWRADGGAYCWLEWDHPAMPWDATRLVVDVAGERTVVAGAGGDESVVQPEWAADASLWFSSDRTGYWSLYRWTRDGGVETMVDLGRDIGFPAWVFGDTCYAFLDAGRVAFVVVEDGLEHLARANARWFGRAARRALHGDRQVDGDRVDRPIRRLVTDRRAARRRGRHRRRGGHRSNCRRAASGVAVRRRVVLDTRAGRVPDDRRRHCACPAVPAAQP